MKAEGLPNAYGGGTIFQQALCFMHLLDFLGHAVWPYVAPEGRPATWEDRAVEVQIRKRVHKYARDLVAAVLTFTFFLPPMPVPLYPAEAPTGEGARARGQKAEAEKVQLEPEQLLARGPARGDYSWWAAYITRWNKRPRDVPRLEFPPLRVPEDRFLVRAEEGAGGRKRRAGAAADEP